MMNIEWWHWMVLGVALMLYELAVPAFLLPWFGPGAFVIGLILSLAPIMGLGMIQKSQIRSQTPIPGSDFWEVIAAEDIRAGDRVDVLDVEGTILRVAKHR